MNKITAQKGFTSLELLLYTAVASLLITAMASFVVLFEENRIKNQSIAEVEQQGQQIIELLSHSIRNAEAITTPAPGASGEVLEIDVYDVADDPTVFSQSSGVMQITEGAGSAIDLTNSRVSISNLTFENLTKPSTPGTVRMSFTLERQANTTRNPYIFEQDFVTTVNVYE